MIVGLGVRGSPEACFQIGDGTHRSSTDKTGAQSAGAVRE